MTDWQAQALEGVEIFIDGLDAEKVQK